MPLSMTPTSDFMVTALLNVEYLRSGMRYRHSYNGIRTVTYSRLLKGVISNDAECLSEIFNETKCRTISLRQLSFLYELLKH